MFDMAVLGPTHQLPEPSYASVADSRFSRRRDLTRRDRLASGPTPNASLSCGSEGLEGLLVMASASVLPWAQRCYWSAR